MNNIKELSLEEIALVSGGNANGNFERTNNISSSKGGAPATAANNAGVGVILGTIGAVATGAAAPVVVISAVIGGIAASLPSTTGSTSNNSGGSWNDTNPGGMVGECRW
ncbi:hypothetical protein MUA04_03410 [Enterobacteriaceae bacterium H11S18]|uniref:hypothetical protein n=1 Tax=Dryocola clanedunensis TaxID=2925396 RepID=UPI0022EFF900|nr:hypothetical protein [Dryocola clanedunensis]MCT4709242.1 hypothetical protein [Dryocola clanedunensis]